MALLKLSGMVTQISGKMGGSILGTSANGSYIKQNSYSQQHATPSQSLQRTKIGLVGQEWRNISPANKALWAAETPNYPYINRVGDTVEYNAYQLFCYLNQNLNLINWTNLTAPATFVAAFSPVVAFQVFTTTQLRISYTSGQTFNSYVVYASPMMSNDIQPKLSQYRKIILVPSMGTAGGVTITTQYENIFGSLYSGAKVFCYIKAVNRNTGIPSISGNIASATIT